MAGPPRPTAACACARVIYFSHCTHISTPFEGKYIMIQQHCSNQPLTVVRWHEQYNTDICIAAAKFPTAGHKRCEIKLPVHVCLLVYLKGHKCLWHYIAAAKLTQTHTRTYHFPRRRCVHVHADTVRQWRQQTQRWRAYTVWCRCFPVGTCRFPVGSVSECCSSRRRQATSLTS